MKTLSRLFNIFVIAGMLITLAISVQPVPQAAAATVWQTVGSAEFTAGEADYTSLALDASGTPYVAFRDCANSAKASVMKFNGSSWVNVGSAGFSAGQADYTSLALDASGTPYVAYSDYANSSKVSVMKFDGSSWVNVGSAGFSAGYADYTSLALDASGAPYVAYRDYANGQKASVMKFNGSSWVNVGPAGFSAGRAPYTSLALDASGTPHVAYRDDANIFKASVMKFNGSSWAYVGPAGFSGGYANWTSLALDASGMPYVAYRDFDNNNGGSAKASVMKFNGIIWETVGPAEFTAGGVDYTSLALDASGTPYVAFSDLANSGKARVMKFNGSSWVNVGPAVFSVGQVDFTSLALDASGAPYVAYMDEANDYKASVMKYGFGSPEMDVKGNGVSIVDGDTTPSLTDNTDFGNTYITGGTMDRVFTIENTSDADLTLSGSPKIVIGGTDAADFSVTADPTSPVAATSGSTTFTIHFDPSATGVRSATISIANNSNKDPYNFNIQGTGRLGWQTVGSAGFSAGEADYTSLALDASGTPYVAFRDCANSAKASVMKFDGGSWVNVGSAGFSAGQADYTSLALDASGTPYVAYSDYANSSKVSVMKFDGSSWVNVGSTGPSTVYASYISLALDASGAPYVAYRDGTNGKARVMKFDGSSWVNIGSAGFSPGFAGYISLALDVGGTPYVAYKDMVYSYKASVMKFNGSSWETVGSAGFSAGMIDYTSLALDASGTPYVAYMDYANSYKASVMKFNGSSWVNVGSIGPSAGRADYPSLAFDGNTPYIAYSDNNNSGKASVMKFDGSSWVNVGSAGFSAGQVYFTSLAFDASGRPYVAYMGQANDYKASVMKYTEAKNTFDAVSRWTTSFDLSHGWTVKDFVRTVGDVNGDGNADLIGFGQDGVYVALSNGSNGFDPISKWTSSFDLSHGWTVKDFVRTVGDVNHDGNADLIGFGQDGVYVALANGSNGFGAISKWTSSFDLSHGWTVADYVRTVGDVNHDGNADLIGFGLDGVYVALSNGVDGFGAISKWTSSFDLSHGWTVADYVRTVGDVNHDNNADLIGFGLDGVYVALSDGSGSFGAISKWTSSFDLSHGWTVKDFVRTVGDVNHDNNADLVGFGQDGVYVALSDGSSGFSSISKWTSSFDLSHGWTVQDFARTVGDVNGDGAVDLVGFGQDGVYIAIAK